MKEFGCDTYEDFEIKLDKLRDVCGYLISNISDYPGMGSRGLLGTKFFKLISDWLYDNVKYKAMGL